MCRTRSHRASLRRKDPFDDRNRRARAAMHDPLHMQADVGLLERLDAPTAAMTLRKKREGVACDLLEDGIVDAARQGHGGGAKKDPFKKEKAAPSSTEFPHPPKTSRPRPRSAIPPNSRR